MDPQTQLDAAPMFQRPPGATDIFNQSAPLSQPEQVAPEMSPEQMDPGATSDQNADGVVDEKDQMIEILQTALKKMIALKTDKKVKNAPLTQAPFQPDQLAQNASLMSEKYNQEMPPFLQQ